MAGFQFLGRRHSTIEHLAELADESYEPPDYWLVGKLVWFVFSAALLVAVQVKIVGWLLGAE